VDARTALREADALHQGRQYKDATAAYRRAVQADPSLIEAWYGLGCASASQYAYGDAVAALRRVVAHRPDAGGARCTLAEALFQLGEVDAAVAERTASARWHRCRARMGASCVSATSVPTSARVTG
jgi:tetratricopeptide (TPR) repeat protein